MEQHSGIGVLDKAVSILDALGEGPATLAELVARTSLPRATAHRLAVALERHGLAARDTSGRFLLGPRMRSPDPLPAAAAPVLRCLRDDTGESAQLYVRRGDVRVCVAVAERPSGLRDTVPVGSVLPMTAGSAATVLLAFADGAAPAVTAPAGTPPDGAALDRVRRQGWAASAGEREAGLASVSAPVRGPQGLVAAISISGPTHRLGRSPGQRFGIRVTEAARQVELALPR